MTKKTAFAFGKTSLITATLVVFLSASPAFSEEQLYAEQLGAPDAVVDILPVKTLKGDTAMPDKSESTHPTIHMTPDKSELVRLKRSAGSIIVGNPAHVNVIADTSQTLVLVPRIPGATYFTVLDNNGDVIMQRHIIVASPKENYVRVRRSCNGESGDGCQNTSVFYCPDMCHEIMISGEGEGDSDESSASAADGGQSSAGDGGSANSSADDAIDE